MLRSWIIPRREERQLDQVGGHEAMPMHRHQELPIAFGQHDRRSGRDLTGRR